jgi:DNA-binding PadR family transcriptional regulator
MLQQLADEGLVKRRAIDGKYEITPQGKEEVEWPSRMQHGAPRSVEGTIDELSSYVSYLEDIARSDRGKISESADRLKDLGTRLTKLGMSP